MGMPGRTLFLTMGFRWVKLMIPGSIEGGKERKNAMLSPHRSSLRALVIASVILFASASDAQTRFKDLIFPSATTTAGIVFGSNTGISGSVDTLRLDLYVPTGDTMQSRPLIVFIHGGSLISGDRGGMATFCSDAARRGYVAATIDYRLGIESPKGVTTILEELLRGVQDTKAAVRFLRSKAAEYSIDTSHIYLYGSSAGSMVAVHYAYWDQDEIPPDVDQVTWGDIEGTSGNPGYSTGIHGIVNYVGATMDPSWIEAGDVPVANFHGLLDPVVPPDSGVSTDFTIVIYGGVRIDRVATELGIYTQSMFFPTMAHGGNEDILRGFAAEFLYSLIVLSSVAPQDLTSMQLASDSLRVFRYDRHLFTSTVLDPNGNRIMLPQSMVQYSCDAGIGTIAPTGIFTPSDHADSGYVYALFNGVTDSCYVSTFDFAFFEIRPKLVVTDTSRTVALRIDTYDADSLKYDIPISMFSLVSTDPSVGTVDAAGVFTGKQTGTTHIIATLGGYSDTSEVRVEVASGFQTIDPLHELTGWTFEGPTLDSLFVGIVTTTGGEQNQWFGIEYSLTYDVSKSPYMIYLNKDIPIYGIPDSIYLDAQTDGRRHRLYYRFEDAEGNIFRALGLKYLNDSTKFLAVNAAMIGLTPLSGVSNVSYPLALKRIEIQLAPATTAGTVTSGTIYLDDVRLKYPVVTGVDNTVQTPVDFTLEQNYPNPFNPSTTIGWRMEERGYAKVSVFDVLGREVAVLMSDVLPAGSHSVTWSAQGFPSGVYFYRLLVGDVMQVRRMILLR